jgi:hypothetical protein
MMQYFLNIVVMAIFIVFVATFVGIGLKLAEFILG